MLPLCHKEKSADDDMEKSGTISLLSACSEIATKGTITIVAYIYLPVPPIVQCTEYISLC